jgi:hypothetical protein
MTKAIASKTKAPKDRKIGHAHGAITYGQEMASKGWKVKAMVWLGEKLDRLLADPNAPIFPHDAPLRQPNCGVVAMCMFTGQPYDTVAPILFRGREDAIGGTYREQYAPTAKELGFKATVKNAPRMTLGEFAETTKGKTGTHFVTIWGHAVVVWDGLIFDQSHPAGETPDRHFTAHCDVVFHMVRA